MDFEKSSIERLKRTLYSRNEDIVPKEKRTPVSGHEMDVPKDWGEPKKFDISTENMTKRNNSFFNKFLLGSFIFFLFALGVALFIFFGGLNMISSNNLDVKIVAPSSVSSGEEFDMGLTVINGNRTDLEGVSMFIDYPAGAQSVGDNSKPLTHETVPLDTIAKGASKDYTIRTLLFGEKDSIKTFTLHIEYSVKGSNATFSKQTTYDVSIGSSPLLLNIDYPKEVNSGQVVKLNIDITSNSTVLVKNTLIKLEYPYGFTYQSSNIKPLNGNTVWNVGDLKNGDKKTLTITGVLIGQNLEDRSFRVTSGSLSADNPQDFDTVLADSTITVGIRKSFFDLSVVPQISQNKLLGQTVPLTIKWQNTLPDKIVNANIQATLSGNVLDRNSVQVGNGGFYRSVDNSVVWDKTAESSLTEILPGDTGQVTLAPSSVAVSPQSRLIKNPHIDVHVVMSGDRTGLDSGNVTSTEDLTVKLASSLSLVAKATRESGPFSNGGPIPPKADTETTYTITWTLTNTSNDLKDSVVTATLPVGVTWKGETSPASEKISFNPDTKVVSWNIGNISAGAGFTISAKEVSFKVGLTPSINQIGLAPSILSQTQVNSTDTYAEVPISVTADSLSTRYTDGSYSPGKETVVK